MIHSTEWDVLRPWCHALGPYLSLVHNVPSEPGAFAGFVVQVSEFLGPASRRFPRNGAPGRLVFLREALELLSLALLTATPSGRQALLCSFENETLQQEQSSHTSELWQPRFQLVFRESRCGDAHDALEILMDLMTKAWNTEPTDAYHATRRAILRPDVEASAAQAHRLRVSVRLQPPLKDTSDFRTSYVSAPTRADTINYYNHLLNVVQAISSTKHATAGGPVIDGLELDLMNLETPADAIARIGALLTLGIRIRRIALQLSYSWDVFDQTKLVRALNASPCAQIDYLLIAATTGDNMEAALESLPLLATVRHVELVDCVVYGDAAPSFHAAFRRTLLSSSAWKPKKLTLRGTHFAGMRLPQKSPGQPASSGLEALRVHLPSQDVDAFMRVLPFFGSSLQSLEIRVESSGAISLASIATACPRLRALDIHGVAIEDLGCVPSLVKREGIAWTSLHLHEVSVPELNALGRLARAFADPTSAFARCVTKFTFVQTTNLTANDVDAFCDALNTNKRLEYLALGPVERGTKTQLMQFDGEVLTHRKVAFLSAVSESARSASALPSASACVDTWNLAHIMEFAGLVRRRQVVVTDSST